MKSRDGRRRGHTRLFPNVNDVSPEDPALTTIRRGQKLARFAVTDTPAGSSYQRLPIGPQNVVELPPVTRLTSITPSTGVIGGGTLVTITGTKLKGATLLQLGGINVQILTNDGYTITGLTGESSVLGLVDLVINAPDGNYTLAGAFTYTMQLTSILPNLGDTAGGQHVSILGKGLTGQSAPTIGGVLVDDFVVLNDGQASAVTGLGATPGAKDVVMGGVTLAAAYTNWDPVSYFSTHLKGYWNANVISSVAFGTGVSQLNDLSGNGHHMVQATGANQPAFSNTDQTFGGATHLIWPNTPNNSVRLEAAITIAQPYTIIWYGIGGSNEANWGGSTGGVTGPWQQYGGSDIIANDTTVGAQTLDKKSYLAQSPLLTADVRNGASSALYVQNSKSKLTGTVTNNSFTNLAMGNIVGGGIGLFNGRVVYMMVIDRAITDAEFEMIAKWTQSFSAPAHPAPVGQLVISGNSFALGALAITNAVEGYAWLEAAAMPSYINAVVDPESGNTTTNMKSGGTFLAKSEASLASKRVCVLQEIGNDLQVAGVDAATALANVLTWAANAVLTGYLPIVITEITRLTAAGWTSTMEGYRVSVNASLLSGATPIAGVSNLYLHSSGTFLVFDQDGALTPTQKDPSNTTYRGDGIHPTTKLHSIIASLELPAIRYAFSTLGIAA